MNGIATRLADWIARWGFALLVGLGAIAAVCVAAAVDLPRDVPSFALQAAPVYRVEVGAAVFAAAYLASMAFALALNNRGFSEIGISGVKADDLTGANRQEATRDQEASIDALGRFVEVVGAELRDDVDKG
jgi:hypothetical protein